MYIKHVVLKNWRNFRNAEGELSQVSYVLGANAAGKSNFLDIFRFLRDIAKPEGGGLQKAVNDRGGVSKIRCLHARHDPEIRIEVVFVEKLEDENPSWRYIIGFKPEGRGKHRNIISCEEVWKQDKKIVARPNIQDKKDSLLLTETYLEQTRANNEFRNIAEFFQNITYLHLVPQLLKYGEKIGGNRIEDDPFGQGFLERIAKTQERTRISRLSKIEVALSQAVPQFKELRFVKDEMGHPHLEAKYEHHRPNAGWQREDSFSDGTLRLLGILWSLQDSNGLLLLEEPELSLNQAVIQQIPLLIERVLRSNRKNKRQILITTHSKDLLSNNGIDADSVLVLKSEKEGTSINEVSNNDRVALDAGLSIADVILPQTKPKNIEQLGFWK
ncbi:ATP-binding protein [uncultured Acinetobacter sp.]|uniref:AAA family ATPase n=1 Tax=uncultured Acinetobacter sp. TaxID=165433 RepID=UPI00258ABF0D|nr:ATP-binding protein [uncultured Acinetobacter sp.]